MLKNFSILLLSCLAFMVTLSPVEARIASEASEATEEPTINEEATTQKLKERIEKVVEEKKEQIKGAINDLTKEKQGFIGEVQRVSEETLTIKTNKGTKILPLNEELLLVQKNQPITPDKIAVGNWVIVIGWLEGDTFVPKKVSVHATSLRPKEHVVQLASIVDISKTSLTIAPRSGEGEQEVTIQKATVFQDHEGKTAKLADFSENIQVLVLGYKEEAKTNVVVVRAIAPFSVETN